MRETEREKKNRLCEINQFITQHLHALFNKVRGRKMTLKIIKEGPAPSDLPT